MGSYALPLDSDRFEFARGFQAGRIFQKLVEEPHIDFEYTIFSQNLEMSMRMAEITDYTLEPLTIGDKEIIVAFLP